MALGMIDFLTLALYLSGILVMSLYFARRNTNTEAYFMGRRSFPHWAIGLSLVGTSISSITFLAYPADAFKTSWLRFLPNLMLPLALVITAVYFLKFFRQNQSTTAYEFLEKRFGPSVRLYCAGVFIISQIVRLSIILYLVALLAHELTGLAPHLCILYCGIFIGLYTVLGGIEAVIWTDVIQTIILIVGGLTCLWIIIDQLPGGLSQIIEVGLSEQKLGFSQLIENELVPVGWNLSLIEKTASMMLLLGLINWLTEYTSNQNTVQRLCAAKSDQDAKRGLMIAACSALPIWAFYMFLGTALFVYYQQFPAIEAQQMLSGELKAEKILPYFILNTLPVGLTGLVLASAIAAAMSSLDSSINSISTVGVVDIYRRHLKPKASDRHYLIMAWIFASLSTFSMIMGALALHSAQTTTLQDTATILTSLLSGGLLSIYLLGFFTRSGHTLAIWCGIFCTMFFSAWVIADQYNQLPSGLSLPFEAYYTAILGNMVLFIVGFVASNIISHRIKKRRQKETQNNSYTKIQSV